MTIQRQIRNHLASGIGIGFNCLGFVSRAQHRLPSGSILPLLFHNPRGDAFRKLICWLHTQGYTFLSSAELIDVINHGQPAPQKSVWISCDDGWRTCLTNMLPTLVEFNVPATFFLTTSAIENKDGFFWFSCARNNRHLLPDAYRKDVEALWRVPIKEREHIISALTKKSHVRIEREAMTVSEVHDLAAFPQVTIGCHTIHHAIMETCSMPELENEILHARTRLEEWCGKPVEYFSYPKGLFDIRVPEILLSHGFKLAATTEEAFILPHEMERIDVFRLPRIALTDDGFFNELRCQTLGILQPFMQRLKSIFNLHPLQKLSIVSDSHRYVPHRYIYQKPNMSMDKPKRLAYFFDSEIGNNRASTIQVLKNCNAFQRSGLDVTLYTPFRKGICIESIRSTFRIDPQVSLQKIKHVKYLKFIINTWIMFIASFQDKSDIIYTRNFYFSYLMAVIGRLVVFECHQFRYDQWYHTRFQMMILKKLTATSNFRLVVISEALRAQLTLAGVNIPMLVCHDGYDEDMVPQNVSVNLDSEGYDVIAMYTGSMKYFKGLGHIEYLAQYNPNVIFYLLGDTEVFCDKNLIRRLRQHANVRFTGYMTHDAVAGFLRKADILLLLPTREGVYNDVTSPLKLFEYMSAGKAILATNGPSLKEILRDGDNGLLAPDDDGAIDRQLKALVEDAGLRTRLGTNAARDIIQYTWVNRAQKIIDFISDPCVRSDQ